jgi:hypothetical protein
MEEYQRQVRFLKNKGPQLLSADTPAVFAFAAVAAPLLVGYTCVPRMARIQSSESPDTKYSQNRTLAKGKVRRCNAGHTHPPKHL